MRWKFEAVAQIVRLLDTIEAPGGREHLSRAVPTRARLSGRPYEYTENEPESTTASRNKSPRKVGNHLAGALVFSVVRARLVASIFGVQDTRVGGVTSIDQ